MGSSPPSSVRRRCRRQFSRSARRGPEHCGHLNPYVCSSKSLHVAAVAQTWAGGQRRRRQANVDASSKRRAVPSRAPGGAVPSAERCRRRRPRALSGPVGAAATRPRRIWRAAARGRRRSLGSDPARVQVPGTWPEQSGSQNIMVNVILKGVDDFFSRGGIDMYGPGELGLSPGGV